ncbi:alginate lyase-domain-containing protein [Mycena olivaceomarginata]|nr:alginate lyase-domain-containing protein [Mycena olivaceomarginata]
MSPPVSLGQSSGVQKPQLSHGQMRWRLTDLGVFFSTCGTSQSSSATVGVTNKPVVAPSGDKHDYMSWAPYQWPDCSNVHNTTVLSPSDIRKLCNYVFRDGQVNPDRNTIQDSQSFSNLSDAVLYNSIAAMLQNKSSSVYSQTVGTYTGILDLRGFAKIASGILLLRKISNSDWTSDLDTQMIVWCNKYIDWLQTAPNAIVAAHATNNHGTIFVNQLGGLKLIVQDTAGAVNWTQGYFSGIFQGQEIYSISSELKTIILKYLASKARPAVEVLGENQL